MFIDRSSNMELLLGSSEATSKAFLDALVDEICVIDSSGLIIAVNEAWARFAEDAGASDSKTGAGQNYLDIARTAAEAGAQDAAQAYDGLTSVLRGEAQRFSMEYECSSGEQRRWFLMTVTSLVQAPGALVSHQDVTARRMVEEALRLSGELRLSSAARFLPSLVRNLALAVHAKHAFLTQVVDKEGDRLRLLAHWTGEGYSDLFSFETKGTPSRTAASGRTAVYRSGVQKLFPDDQWLREVDAESYAAVPLFDAEDAVLGHLGIIDSNPMEDAAFVEAMLRTFASRATPEMERLQLEVRLADQSRLIDSAPDAIVGIDENFAVTYWNKAAEKTYGWRADEVMGTDITAVFQTQISEEERAAARRLLEEAGELRGEFTQRRKDGSEVEIGATAMAYRGPDGQLTGYVSINRDITEQKRAELALRQVERANQAILDAIPDMMFTLDGDGRFLSFKPAQSVSPLVAPSAFLGRHIEDVMPADLAPSIMATIRACLRSGQTQTLVYQLVEEGLRKDYEARVLPIGPDEVVAIVRDYTDQRRGERAESEERRAAAGESETAYLTAHGPRRRSEKSVVLIVDQDVQALRFLRRFLEHAGHKPIVTSDSGEAVRLAELETPDLILLDVMLPGTGGVDLLRELRPLSQAPIVVLIPTEREEEAVSALEMGADDYIRKPISPPELKARIEAALRRRRAYEAPKAERLELGELAIDRAARLVTVGGSEVSLTPTEYGLLSELADSAGRVMTHDEILERVWGPGYAGNHELLRSFVGSLRKKLGDDPNDPRFLRSERGVGYRLVKPTQ